MFKAVFFIYVFAIPEIYCTFNNKIRHVQLHLIKDSLLSIHVVESVIPLALLTKATIQPLKRFSLHNQCRYIVSEGVGQIVKLWCSSRPRVTEQALTYGILIVTSLLK